MYSIGNMQQHEVGSSLDSSVVGGVSLNPEEGDRILTGHAGKGLPLKNVLDKEIMTTEELPPLDEESHPADGTLPELNEGQERKPFRRCHKRRAGLREAAAFPGTATSKQLEKWLSSILTDLRYYSRAADRELLLLVRNPLCSDFKVHAYPDELPWQRRNALYQAIVGDTGGCGVQLVAKIEKCMNRTGVGLSECNNFGEVKSGDGNNCIAAPLRDSNSTSVSPSVLSCPPPNLSNCHASARSQEELDPVELMYHCQLALFQHIKPLAVNGTVIVPVLKKRRRNSEDGESGRREGYEKNAELGHDNVCLPIAKCMPQRGGAKSRLSVAIGRTKKPVWWDTDLIGEEWDFFGHRVRHDGWSKRPHSTLQEVVNSKRRYESLLATSKPLDTSEHC